MMEPGRFIYGRKDGVTLAVSRGTSNGPDATDVVTAIQAFEEMNSVLIVVTLRPTRGGASADVWLEGKAMSRHDASGVRSLLAFASVKCLGSRHKTLDTATLALLYALDFQLAQAEFDKTRPEAETAPGAPE